MRWIKDEDFIRGNIPMTKFEVRMVTMGVMEISEKDVMLDIGAGTGSVSVEAALQGAEVYALEREEEGVALIRKNAEKFGVDIHIIQDHAPQGIEEIGTFNKCFIGGSGGKLGEIVDAIHRKLKPGGIVAANFVTVENLVQFQHLLRQYEYANVETRVIQASMADGRTGILKAQNPVFIVKGEKK